MENNKDISKFKVVELDLMSYPPRIKEININDYPPPVIPDEIDLEVCDYAKICTIVRDIYTDKIGNKCTDDEIFQLFLDIENKYTSFGYYVQIPTNHSCYKQAVDQKLRQCRDLWRDLWNDKPIDITANYRDPSIRVVNDNKLTVYPIRVWWLHSPGPEGSGWGSNNWTNEKGRKRR